MKHFELSLALLAGFSIAAVPDTSADPSVRRARVATNATAASNTPTLRAVHSSASDSSGRLGRKRLQKSPPTNNSATKNSGDTAENRQPLTLSPWTTAGALAAVVGLILVLARLFRKHGPRLNPGIPAEALEVLGRRFIDHRQAIVLVRLGSKILVVGSSPSGLQPLGEVNDPIEVDMLAGSCRPGMSRAGLGTSFLKMFQGHSTRRPAPPNSRARDADRNSAFAGSLGGVDSGAAPTADPQTMSARSKLAPEPRFSTSDRPQAEHDLIRRLRAGESPGHHAGSIGGLRD